MKYNKEKECMELHCDKSIELQVMSNEPQIVERPVIDRSGMLLWTMWLVHRPVYKLQQFWSYTVKIVK